MSIAAAALAVSISSLTVSIGGFAISRHNSKISELNLLGNLQREWAGLRRDWQRAILTVYGPEGYYSPADKTLRSEYTAMLSELRSPAPQGRDERGLLWPWISSIQNVIEFMATVSSYVLSGQLTPEHAYAIFGPEVARRSGPVRVLLGETGRNHWDTGSLEQQVRLQLTAGQYTGRAERVLCLLDILWSRAAVLQDMYTHDLLSAAKTKRKYETGFRNRERIRRLSKQIGGSRITSWRLAWYLTNSEVVRQWADVRSFSHEHNELNLRIEPHFRATKFRRVTLLWNGVLGSARTRFAKILDRKDP